jgi:hypothetical protein
VTATLSASEGLKAFDGNDGLATSIPRKGTEAMNGIRLAGAIALACTIVLPQAANAQNFGLSATVRGTVVLADSYPGDLRIPCAKVVVIADVVGSQPLVSGPATAVPGTTRECEWQMTVPRVREIVFAANAVPVADYNVSTPVNVAASAKSEPVAIQLVGNLQPITLALVPSAAFPVTPTGVLTIVSGNSQSGQFDPRLSMGAYVHFTKPLVVKLTTTAGVPMAGTPVTFACPSGSSCKLQGDLIFASGMTQSGGTTITVNTNTNGEATLGVVYGCVVTYIAAYTSENAQGNIPVSVKVTSGNQTATYSFTMMKQTTGLVGE